MPSVDFAGLENAFMGADTDGVHRAGQPEHWK